MMKLLTLLFFVGFYTQLLGQELQLKGVVKDESGKALPGATVLLQPGAHALFTNVEGRFVIQGLKQGRYVLELRFLGYKTVKDSFLLSKTISKDYTLEPALENLEEVVISDHYAEERNKEISLNADIVDHKFIKRNLGASLMNSLDRLPGVDAMNIGSGQAKPVIRGLSFNRVVVVENGITHQGQQWGADHGLEIDQYAINRVEVIRGPASLMYGSDAIGGIIDLKQLYAPQANSISGSVNLTAKTNNGLLGTSAEINYARDNWFVGFRTTQLFWGDFKVPTDSVDVYGYRVPLHNNYLRNTAGKEQDYHLTLGYSKRYFSSRIYASLVQSTSGFFANAHGLEPRSIDEDFFDASSRDIDLPRQKVQHFKVINRNRWQWKKGFLESNLGWQKNLRSEHSIYTSHGYMPPVFPEGMPFEETVERAFDKQIFSFALKAGRDWMHKAHLIAGLNTEYQDNAIDGRGFMIPAFKQFTSGAFVYGRLHAGKHAIWQGGLRYDFAHLSINPYSDWFPSAIIQNQDTQWVYLARATSLDRNYSNLVFSFGYNYNSEHLTVKLNVGKSFRFPLAQELAANGVNYHYFRYERGNEDLKPEIAYQWDGGLEWHRKKVAIGFTPFFTWFQNYIYLNPSYEHDRLYGNGNQIYDYEEAQVMRFGAEIHAHYTITSCIKAGFIADYVYSEQMSGPKKGFTLPFSPPGSTLLNLRYNPKKWGPIAQPYLSMDWKWVWDQNLIVPPEEKTEGYHLVHLAFGGDVKLKKLEMNISLQIQNLFNRKYFNHTSFYRLINVPEAGRNFIINLKIPFQTFLKT